MKVLILVLTFFAHQALACEMKHAQGVWWYICPGQHCCQKYHGKWMQQCGGCPGSGGNTGSGSGSGGSGSLKVMSYNVFGWNALRQNSWKAKNVYRIIKDFNPDIIGIQEEEHSLNSILAGLNHQWQAAPYKTKGKVILYKNSVVTYTGGSTRQYSQYGQYHPRTLDWAQFTHRSTGKKIDFYNAHWCVCDGNKLLTTARETVNWINGSKRSGSTVILTGDMNAAENSAAINHLKASYEDSWRKIKGGANGNTMGGRKIDFVFVSRGTSVTDAKIDRRFNGQASDHYAITATIRV